MVSCFEFGVSGLFRADAHVSANGCIDGDRDSAERNANNCAADGDINFDGDADEYADGNIDAVAANRDSNFAA